MTGHFAVVSNEISEGIMANSISRSVDGKIVVTVMNTREEAVILNFFTPGNTTTLILKLVKIMLKE